MDNLSSPSPAELSKLISASQSGSSFRWIIWLVVIAALAGAGYFAWRLGQGASLKEALEAGLKDLDGFFTFAVGTPEGFAVVRDAIACKPALLAETDDWVGMASEYRAFAGLPGIGKAKIWEPAPSMVYSWSRH